MGRYGRSQAGEWRMHTASGWFRARAETKLQLWGRSPMTQASAGRWSIAESRSSVGLVCLQSPPGERGVGGSRRMSGRFARARLWSDWPQPGSLYGRNRSVTSPISTKHSGSRPTCTKPDLWRWITKNLPASITLELPAGQGRSRARWPFVLSLISRPGRRAPGRVRIRAGPTRGSSFKPGPCMRR